MARLREEKLQGPRVAQAFMGPRADDGHSTRGAAEPAATLVSCGIWVVALAGSYLHKAARRLDAYAAR
jgi:hypothetical protein